MARPKKLPRGMWLRGDVFYARFRANGRLIRERLSTDFAVAERMLHDVRERERRAGNGELDNNYPLWQLKDEWLRAIAQTTRPGTLKRYGQNCGNLERLLSVQNVQQVTMDLMDVFRQDRLLEGVTARTVNMDVGCLKTMFNWAVDRKKIASNPLAKYADLDHEAKEARPFSDDEVKRLLDASSSPMWRDIWYAYLTTGVRKMELANLLFSDIDWQAGELIVRGTTAKGHRTRRIPFDDELAAILRRQRESAPDRKPGKWADDKTTAKIADRFSLDHVFVTGQNTPLGGNIYREFIATCKRAGIETVTNDAEGNVVEFVDLHSTRHTYATNLIMNGADPKTVQELLGHRTLDMTMRIYAKVFSANKRAAVAKLSYGSGVTETPDLIKFPVPA